MYGGYYGYGYYFDPTYFLVLIGLVLCLGASALVNSTMRKYSKIRNMRGITGAEAARNLLNREGLYNVQIECLNANDGDHRKLGFLSSHEPDAYSSASQSSGQQLYFEHLTLSFELYDLHRLLPFLP